MTDYIRHPIAVPLTLPLNPEQEDALKLSIRTHGVIHPVMLLDGQILDGWARYIAARACGCELPTTEYKGSQEPSALVAYLLAVNIHRKHYTKLQRALLAARLLDSKRGVVKGGPQEFKVNDAASLFSVSPSYINLCHRALLSKNTALIHDIELGNATLDQIKEVLGRPVPSPSKGKLAAVKPDLLTSIADKLVKAIQELTSEQERKRLAQAIYERIKTYLHPGNGSVSRPSQSGESDGDARPSSTVTPRRTRNVSRTGR